MDPMQVQNPQQQIPVNPVQVPVQAQVFVPQQQIPVQGQVFVSQQIPQQQIPVQVVEQDGIFDKILKGIVDFIAKLAGQPAPQQNGVQTQVVMPQQQIPQQNMTQQMGGLLGQLGTGLGNMVNQAAQATQTYINEPVETQQVANTQQQILNQNYQQNPMQQQVVVPQQVVPQQVVPQVPVQQQIPVQPQVVPQVPVQQ